MYDVQIEYLLSGIYYHWILALNDNCQIFNSKIYYTKKWVIATLYGLKNTTSLPIIIDSSSLFGVS